MGPPPGEGGEVQLSVEVLSTAGKNSSSEVALEGGASDEA